MFPFFRNPLVEREQRMREGRRKARINGTRLSVSMTAKSTTGVLSRAELEYLDHLCGFETLDKDVLTPHQKARIGNAFERACRIRRSRISRHPRHEQVEALPGIQLVPLNRELVRRLQSEAGRRKRQRP